MILAEARANREFWGRLVESAVGAHLFNASAGGAYQVFYWRDRNREVDFVVQTGKRIVAIEVKGGHARHAPGSCSNDRGDDTYSLATCWRAVCEDVTLGALPA